MASVLCICEQGYRASVEEQDDTVVWIAHMLHKNDDTEASVLLRGSAVNYANKGQRAVGVTFGDWKQAHPPDLARDLASFQADGGKVYALEEDVNKRGLGAGDLIDGVTLIAKSGIAELVAAHDNVSFW